MLRTLPLSSIETQYRRRCKRNYPKEHQYGTTGYKSRCYPQPVRKEPDSDKAYHAGNQTAGIVHGKYSSQCFWLNISLDERDKCRMIHRTGNTP